MARILLVEDEAAIADAAIYALQTEAYEVVHVGLGREALALLQSEKFDVLILDVGLPDQTGFDVCRELRKFSQIPLIFLTARGGEIDRVLGLEIGADDYMVKPFSPRELVARVRVCLRRNAAAEKSGSQAASARFKHDPQGQRIEYMGQILNLTRYEYLLLATLLSRPGAVFSRAKLMQDIWVDALETADRTVDTHIKTLRAKLRTIDVADVLQTHRGMGYSISIH
ncbi:MAG TPA: two-component system response regulator CreB [Arenimonas sp.]|nr:two-component system response regulator CreB [Arenimonas sp.]HPW32248.1 two-component system response regulator CreB [Arenimonas sp.]